MLVKWVGFLYTMHWPQGEADLGVDGVSYVELLILYQLWAGERLVLKRLFPSTAGRVAQFQCRLVLLVQALIFGAPAGFIGALLRWLCALPGGIGRFTRFDIGPITAGFGTLVGRSAVMDLLPGLVSQHRKVFK